MSKSLAIKSKPKPPKSVLKEGVIYYSDNGRMICVHCAGMSAKYTGRDISGQKVTAATREDAMWWEKETGKLMSCESGCTTYASMKPANAKICAS